MRLFVLTIILLAFHQASAWIYPEHRYIALLAMQKLSPEYRSALDGLWLQARRRFPENRMDLN